MLTLLSRIEQAARSARTVVFVDGDEFDSTTWSALYDDACDMAAGLQALGIAPGDHVAILGPTTRSLVTAIESVWLAGGCLVMLPLPMRLGSIDLFVEQTRARIATADVSLVVIDPQLAEFIEPRAGDPTFVTFDEIAAACPGRAHYRRPADDPSATAVLQFTSGSTSDPKGVVLQHRQICANLDGAIEASGVRAEHDVMVSWLPLYHDMGLIGLLTIPMTTGSGLVLGAPQDFLARPSRWMEWVSKYGGTITAGPNFSYVLAARSLRRASDLDLSSLEIVLNGAEPIDPASFRSFFEAGEKFGLRSTSAFAAFGMAELCIAGCFPARGQGLRTDVVDGRLLEHDHIAVPVAAGSVNARELAILGKPVAGLEMRIVDPTSDKVVGDRVVGELQIRGTSLTPGYYRQPEASAELLADGWLHTGDLAYFVDGDMIMCGRIKDVIIIGGRNIHPQDIERVVGSIEGVRTGNVIAFGVAGRRSSQHIVVVAETKSPDIEMLTKEITRVVTDDIGVPPRHVVMVGPGTIPKTSSGKLQRSACRFMYESGEMSSATLVSTGAA